MMLDKKLILFGGKGGVGKTTLSSATALLLSRKGRRVLLVSTDPAHSLSDILGVEGKGILKVTEGLHVLEIDPEGVVKEYIKNALASIEPLVSPDVFEKVREAFRSVEETPGTEESATLEELSKTVLRSYDDYEHFVIDTAPTGHTLQMLKTVGRVGAWLEELLKRRKTAKRFWSAGGRDKEDRALDILEERRRRFSRFSEILLSRETLFVPVLNPERLSIEETSRLVTSLRKLGVGVDTLVVNKVLPENVRDEFLTARKEQEREYMREIEERFRGMRIVKMPMRDRDVRGMEQLEEVAVELGRRLGV